MVSDPACAFILTHFRRKIWKAERQTGPNHRKDAGRIQREEEHPWPSVRTNIGPHVRFKEMRSDRERRQPPKPQFIEIERSDTDIRLALVSI